jgi:hypothetical protein
VINIDMRSFSFSDSYMRAINEKVMQEQLRRIELERTKADKWDGKLPEAIYAGAPIPFLNVSK